MSGRLGTLSQSLAGHFAGSVAVFETLMRSQDAAQEIRERTQFRADAIEAQREGQEAQMRGATDALAGREVDPNFAANRHYLDARASTAGELTGRALMDRWGAEVLQRAPAGADIERLTADWLQQNARPTGDARFDFAAARILRRGIDMATSRWRQQGIQQAEHEGVRDFLDQSALRVQRGELTPEGVQEMIAGYRTRSPRDAENAPARVLQILMDNADLSPQGIARLEQVLNHPASGGNGQSFMERHAGLRSTFEQNVMQRAGRARSQAQVETANGFLRDIEDFAAGRGGSYVETLVQLRTALNEGRISYGDHERLYGGLRQAQNRLIEATAGINSVRSMIAGETPVDPSVVRRHLGAILRDDANPLAAPEAAGLIVGRLGVLDDTTRQTMGTAMVAFGNREQQVAAFRFWNTVAAGRGGVEAALDMMPENSRAIFQAMRAMDAGNNRDLMNTVLDTLQRAGGNDFSRLRREMPITALTGKANEAEARAELNRVVEEQVAERLGTEGFFGRNNVRVSEALASRLREAVYVQALADRAVGLGSSLSDSANRALEGVAMRVDAIPGVDGRLVAVPRADGQVHADGRPVVPASRAAVNPATRQPEDTIARFEGDRDAALRALPNAFRGGRVGLAAGGPDVPPGVYPIIDAQGAPVVFHAGQRLAFNGQEVEVPREGMNAATALTSALGDRFVVMQRAPGIFALGYRFGFSEPNLDQRERQWRAPGRASGGAAGPPASPMDSLNPPEVDESIRRLNSMPGRPSVGGTFREPEWARGIPPATGQMWQGPERPRRTGRMLPTEPLPPENP